MNVGIIGAGKVGFTIGKYFSTHGLQVSGYFSRSTASAEEAALFTGSRCYRDVNSLVDDSDVLFLTVPDGAITSVYRGLASKRLQGKYIGHTSGALTSVAAFPEIEYSGAIPFSVHPLFAVSDRYHAYEHLSDIFFAIEGAKSALEALIPVFSGIGLHVTEIAPETKTTYHCAAAIASNLVNALIYQSQRMLVDCGFSEEDSMKALTPLIRGNVEHVLSQGVVESLTGPLERADISTIRKHLNCLPAEESALYCLLSRQLLPAVKCKHPERDYSSIEQLFQERLQGNSIELRKDGWK